MRSGLPASRSGGDGCLIVGAEQDIAGPIARNAESVIQQLPQMRLRTHPRIKAPQNPLFGTGDCEVDRVFQSGVRGRKTQI